jgi:hypothetical protein
MLDWIAADPAGALIRVIGAVAIVGMGILLWVQLEKRTRANGGGLLAGAAVAAGIALLIVSLIPGLFSFELGIMVLIAAFFALYRPDVVVKATGGPRKEWDALREGRELGVLVRERGGPRAARSDAEIQARLAGLSKLETPATSEYLSLVRQTLFSDPADPALDAARAQLAAADAALRESLGVRPAWERALERRARGEAPVE